jgi:signal transduction histidine kinase
VLDSLVNTVEKINSPRRKAETLLQIIRLKNERIDKDNLEYLRRAEEIINENEFNRLRLELYIQYGIYYKHSLRNYKSLQYYIRALRLNDRYDFEDRQGRIYREMAETYRASPEYDKSLEYLGKAKKFYKKNDDSINLSAVFNRYAAVYYEIDSSQQAVKYARMSNAYMAGIDFPGRMINNNILIGASYKSLKKYDSSLVFLKKALMMLDSLDDQALNRYFRYQILTNMAITAYSAGNYKESIKYNKNAIKYIKENNLPFDHHYPYAIIARAWEKIGNYEKAYRNYVIASELKDSLYQHNKQRLTLEMETKYETEKQQQQIEQQEKMQTYQIIIFSVILIFTAWLAYMFYSKQKIQRNKNDIIAKQNEELTEANATKDRFFSIIAHDLVNPVNSVKSIMELTNKDYELSAEEREEMNRLVYDSINKLAQLLNNLLTWARSQLGKIKYDPYPVAVGDIINSAVDILEIQAAKKNITIEKEISDKNVIADSNMIQTVVRNIVSNAIKFTPECGKVIISAREKNSHAEISISDNGIGIPREDINKLFRIDISTTSIGTAEEKGTGLGLIICNAFVKKHGSQIKVESRLGEGSTFTFSLPLA